MNKRREEREGQKREKMNRIQYNYISSAKCIITLEWMCCILMCVCVYTVSTFGKITRILSYLKEYPHNRSLHHALWVYEGLYTTIYFYFIWNFSRTWKKTFVSPWSVTVKLSVCEDSLNVLVTKCERVNKEFSITEKNDLWLTTASGHSPDRTILTTRPYDSLIVSSWRIL